MLLTYHELSRLVETGAITGVEPDAINAASIDIHLGDSLLVESPGLPHDSIVDLSVKGSPRLEPAEFDEERGGFLLEPARFALANTREMFFLPNDVACEFKLKSSLARAGLGHALAGWADPGFWDATLTLELLNDLSYHALLLKPGMPIGQLVFWRGELVPMERSYRARGRYNGQRDATPARSVA